jgi:nicotinamide mononucleotide transporter
MPILEIAANAFNLLSVFLAYKNSIHTWWTGIIAVALFAILFFEVSLYADVTLQIYFLITSAYGWWNWVYGDQSKNQLPITRTTKSRLLPYIIGSLLVYAGYSYLLHAFTDASYPFIDSIVLVASVMGQFLLMERKLENWCFWLLVDLIAVPLFLSKELYLTALIYFAFLINAILGLYNWIKIYRMENEAV